MKLIIDADGSTDAIAIGLMHKALETYYGNVNVSLSCEQRKEDDNLTHTIIVFEREEHR